MRRTVIIQARMTSTRLPGKVLMELDGKPMLTHLLDRVKQCRSVDEIVVATTVNETDEPVVRLCEQEDCRWYRGDELDVLARFAGAAREAGADLIVRLTADCPLIDPCIVDEIVDALQAGAHLYDYASNVIERTYPRGLDTEAMFFDTLVRTDRTARLAESREHVTTLIYRERPELFRLLSIRDGAQDNSDLSWTVDTAADLAAMRQLCVSLKLGSEFKSYREILRHVRRETGPSRLFGLAADADIARDCRPGTRMVDEADPAPRARRPGGDRSSGSSEEE